MAKKTTTRSRKRSKAEPVSIENADFGDAVQRYIDGVIDRTIVAGRLVRLAVMRHVDDLKNAKQRGFIFDEHRANEAIWFIETCMKHTKNSIAAKAGDPLILTPSQRFIVWCVFGWRKIADGLRRFEKVFLEVARKWGKSTFAAALALLLLVFDFPIEPAAEIYAAATKEKQAKIVHTTAKRMVRKSPALRSRLTTNSNSIQFPATDGTFQPIGSDSDTTDGLDTAGVVMDEVHAWRKHHRGLHEKLTTAGGGRLQPLLITITTAGDDRAEIWIEEHDYCVEIVEASLHGTAIDDSVFAFIAAIDEEHTCVDCGGRGKIGRKRCQHCTDGTVEADDPFDPHVWPKANPNLVVTKAGKITATPGNSAKSCGRGSVSIDYVRKKANEAKNKPAALNSFLRYFCNLRVSSSEKAIDPLLWIACRAELASKPPRDYPAGRGGFDLGRSDDWASWATMHPIYVEETDSPFFRYELRYRAYTCEGRPEAMHTDRIQRWIDDPDIPLDEHSGDQVDFGQIERDILEATDVWNVSSWAFDPTFATAIAQTMINDHGLELVKFGQSPRWYNESIRTLQRIVKQRRLAHAGDECLAWQSGNLVIVRNARDEWMPDKANSSGKIDSMVAALMALAECLFHETESQTVYEHRGIRTL